MAIRTLLKFRNLDLTKDINDRFTSLVVAGVFKGGDVIPVAAQLKVDLVAPWKIVNKDGMVVEETSDNSRLDTPEGQTTVIAVKAIYHQNDVPEIEVVAIEQSAFSLLSDQDDYVVFATVVVPIGATSVLSGYIHLSTRDIVDPVGRNTIRAVISSTAELPPASDNLDGDLYVVAPGGGTIPHIYGWDGNVWVVLTDAATVSNDLWLHRNNYFTDEKHATDDQKDALVGSSGTDPSAANPYVDSVDPRVPTQDENDALQGSDGSPSNSNRYITQEFALAVPEEKAFATAPTGATPIFDFEGPVYVGLQGAGSATPFFMFYESASDRQYTTDTGSRVLVENIYTDSGLTQPLDPSTNANVDAKGFFSGATLYVKFDVTPDTEFRLMFGRQKIFEIFPIDAFLLRSIGSIQTSSDAVTTVEAISGRDWDDTPPVNEQNIELRKDIVDLKEYVSVVFNSDYVVFDFEKVNGIPDFAGDFEPNVGVPPDYHFENTSLVTFTYDPTTGTVTYAATIANGSVVAGDVFIDGDLEEYSVTSIPTTETFVIQRRNGSIPLAIDTTVTEAVHGSVKPDNNPRKVNLSVMNHLVGRERVHCREIEIVQNEFNLYNGNVAFQIRNPVHSTFYKEPRIRLYGGAENRDTSNRRRVVFTNLGAIWITGFFTDCRLIVDLKSDSPPITVKIDGDPTGTVIDLSRAGQVADLGTEIDIQQQSVSIAESLSDAIPHTIIVEIGNAAGDFVLYGMDLFRSDPTNTLIVSGRAFVQSDLYKADTLTTYLTPVVPTRSRGAVSTRFVNRSLNEQTTTIELTDFDGISGGPAGVAIPATTAFTVTSGFTKFALYRPNDIVKVITGTEEEIKQISTIGPAPGLINFSTPVTSSGAAILLHIASPGGESADPMREYARYEISELGTQQDGADFGEIFIIPGDRLYTVEDGTTSIVGRNIRYTVTDIDGASIALEMVDSTSELRFRAVGTRFDILTVNTNSVTADIQIDGSPAYTITIPGGGLSRVPLWTNARYQSHEVLISNAADLRVSTVLLHEPIIKPAVQGTLLGTQELIADHDGSRSEDGSVIPTGAIGVDPFTMGGVYVNGTGVGTDWTYTVDYTLNPWWGRFLQNDREGSYFEYYLLGSGFEMEYFARNDFGRPLVFVDGILATQANFPTAAFKGLDSVTGQLDMYDASATTIRKKMMITGVPYGKHLITVVHQTPRDKNPASAGTVINVGAFYEISDSGRMSYTPSRGARGDLGIDDFVYGLDWVRDERNFDSGAIAKEEVPVVRTVVQPVRAQSIELPIGITFIDISFTIVMGDSDYAVTANLNNEVDVTPDFQPITITNRTTSGFRAQWNQALPTANYSLNYTAIKFL